MPIDLLVVVASLDLGGAERHLTQVPPRLDKIRFRAAVFCLTHRGPPAPPLEQVGIEVLEPDSESRARSGSTWRWVARKELPSFLGLRRALRVRRPDIVHFFLPMANLVVGMTSLEAPVASPG